MKSKAKVQSKPTPDVIFVQLEYTTKQHRALCALAAASGDSVEDFVKDASLQIGRINSDTIGDEIAEALK
jgi:predicted lactoylglutathione lyase